MTLERQRVRPPSPGGAGRYPLSLDRRLLKMKVPRANCRRCSQPMRPLIARSIELFIERAAAGTTAKTADPIEEEALLAICSYPAATRGDRRANAEYLLAAEARGELDLEVHMQAILH